MVATLVVPTPTRVVETADARLEVLRSQLTGQLIDAGSASYDDSRKTVSVLVDRRPLAIVKAANAQDVAATVNFARDNGLPLSVRGGGHSLASYSVIDDAVVVDLSAMKRVRIDPRTRTAYVQGGATSADLAGPANEHELALSTGDTATVGMGGLTTGGGIGYMVRKYGLAIDNLLSAQVVIASGEIVTASETEHPDLFWAIRGGGGNFGVITEFVFRLAPVGQILGGALILPATREVIRGYLDYSVSAPEDLTTIANLMYLPPLPFIPQERVGELAFVILVCWSGNIEEGERALAPLRALATPIVDDLAPIPYPAIYKYTDHFSAPHAASIRQMFADSLSDAAIDAMLDAMKNASSPFSLIQLRGLGGAFARVGTQATAFAHRKQDYFVAIIGIWLDPAENAAKHQAWTGSLWETIRPEGSGVYVNFLEREGPERIREAYPPVTYAYLSDVKRRYDPTNLFHFNQNILPRP